MTYFVQDIFIIYGEKKIKYKKYSLTGLHNKLLPKIILMFLNMCIQ